MNADVVFRSLLVTDSSFSPRGTSGPVLAAHSFPGSVPGQSACEKLLLYLLFRLE